MRNIEDFPKELTPQVVKQWRNFMIVAAGIEISAMKPMGATEKYFEMDLAYFRIVDILTNPLNANFEPNSRLVMPEGITCAHFETKTWACVTEREQIRRVKTSPDHVDGEWLFIRGWNDLKRDCGNECLEIFQDICPHGKMKSGTNVKAVILELRCRLYNLPKPAKKTTTIDEEEPTASESNKRPISEITNDVVDLEMEDEYVDGLGESGSSSSSSSSSSECFFILFLICF